MNTFNAHVSVALKHEFQRIESLDRAHASTGGDESRESLPLYCRLFEVQIDMDLKLCSEFTV